MNVLVVSPHADDEVLGCGATIARHVAAGDTVSVLIVGRATSDLYSAEDIEKPLQEARVAHALLGVHETCFLDYPAPRMHTVPQQQVSDSIRRRIVDVAADVVYLPHRGDIHSDHGVVYYATLVAARPINDCSVRRLLCYETLSETEWAPPTGADAFIPTVFVDVSSHLQSKLEAMEAYASQIKRPPHPRSLESITALARFRGGTVGAEFAEAFMLVREILA